jgi:hypothetical protein
MRMHRLANTTLSLSFVKPKGEEKTWRDEDTPTWNKLFENVVAKPDIIHTSHLAKASVH